MCIRDRFVEKAHANLVKETRRGGQSLEMKKLKEEQTTVETILQMLKDGKDVRKGNWSPKEVCRPTVFTSRPIMMNKSYKLYNPSSSNVSPTQTRPEKMSFLTTHTHKLLTFTIRRLEHVANGMNRSKSSTLCFCLRQSLSCSSST